MRTSTLSLRTPDGVALHVNRWLPDGVPTAIVQIAHGMAEHSERYARFAEALTQAGYAVYASDHRGHGLTAQRPEDEGYYADEGGFDLVVDDLHLVTATARNEHPGVPLFLLGHSMGSFLSRAYATRYGSDLAGLVLTGTGGDPGLLGRVGAGLAALEARLRGRRHKSALLDKLVFGQYNAAFKPTRTDFDWLSRDPAEVDAYIADTHCGNVFTSGFFADLLGGIVALQPDSVVARVPKDLPVHLVAGAMDPVGNRGAGVEQVAEQYRRVGVQDVTVRLWPGARHEVLNETNRDEVTREIIAWLDAHRTEG